MPQVNPYINFRGNCEEAFNFYKSVFGGEFPMVGRYKDMPPSEGEHTAMDGEKIMHMSLPISKETCLMGSDIGGEWAKHTIMATTYKYRSIPKVRRKQREYLKAYQKEAV